MHLLVSSNPALCCAHMWGRRRLCSGTIWGSLFPNQRSQILPWVVSHIHGEKAKALCLTTRSSIVRVTWAPALFVDVIRADVVWWVRMIHSLLLLLIRSA